MGCLKTAPLFSTCETAYLVQSAVKGSPPQERHWHTEVSPAKGRQAFDGRERMFEEELREVLNPKERRKRCDVIAVYYYPVGRCSEDRFSVLEAHCGRTRENGHEFGTQEILNQYKKTFFLSWGWSSTGTGAQRNCDPVVFFSVFSFTSTP